MKISCVLITKYSEYPKIVLERLTLGFFDEILIKTESPSVYQRYLLAKEAKNDIIYFQDDDCLLNYQNLYKHYNGQLTNAMPLNFKQKYDEIGCTLVGWGCYINKSMLSVFDKYIEKYGENDPHLLREADRIFTCFNKPHNTIIMPHEDLFQDGDRMSSPDKLEFHFKSANEALRKCNLL